MAGASRPIFAMSKAFRWTGVAFAFLVIFIVAVLLFAKQLMEFAASTVTGRDVQIAGAFEIDYSLAPRMHASKVTVANPDWSEHPTMLNVDLLTVQVELFALLHGTLVLPDLRLESPVLILEKTAQGPANWHLGGGDQNQKPADKQMSWLPSIEHLFVSDGLINYYQAGEDLKVTATIDRLEATAGLDQPMSLSAVGMLNGVAYKLAANGAPIASAMDTAAGAYSFALQVSTAPMELRARGELGAQLAKNDSDIQWSIEGSSLAKLLPEERHPSLNQDYKMEGRLRGGSEKWRLSDFHVKSGKTVLHGSMALDTTGKTPFLRASVEAPVVNLDVLEELATAWTGPGDKAGESSSLPFVWKRLNSVNAQVHLSVDRIVGNGLPLKNLVVDAFLTEGKLKLIQFVSQLAADNFRQPWT